MSKKVAVLATAGAAAYAYYRGYRAGRQSSTTEEQSTPSEPVEVVVDPDGTANGGGSENTGDGEYECTDSDCTDTFDSERGRNIHYGQVHG